MDIQYFSGEGYMPLISFEGWRVAVVNYCDRLSEKNFCKVERHLKTDEVFILLQGEANLFIGMEIERYPMEIGKLYTVKCGEWHGISMNKGASVVIVENDDTGIENSEYFFFRGDDNNV